MAEKVVIKIKKVNGENVIRIKGNPESKYHINLMAQKLRLGGIKPTKRLKIKRFFKKLNRVINQLAEEILNQPKADRMKPPRVSVQMRYKMGIFIVGMLAGAVIGVALMCILHMSK